MGELAAQDLARSQYSRDVIPSQASAFKQQRPNANVGAIQRQKLENETRVVGGVLSRMFPWMYQKPADERGKTSVARMQVKQAEAAQSTVQEVKKGNSILGQILKNWLSGVLLWSLLKEPLTQLWNTVIKPWWEASKNPIVVGLRNLFEWGSEVWEWLKGPFAEWVKGTWDKIKDFVKMLPEFFAEFLSMLGGMWDVMREWFLSSFLPNIKLALANLLTGFAGFLDKLFGGRTLFETLKHGIQEGLAIPILRLLETAMIPEVANPLAHLPGRPKVIVQRQPLFGKTAGAAGEARRNLEEKIAKEKEASKGRSNTRFRDMLAGSNLIDFLDPPTSPGATRDRDKTFGGTPNWTLPSFADPRVGMPGAAMEDILKRTLFSGPAFPEFTPGMPRLGKPASSPLLNINTTGDRPTVIPGYLPLPGGKDKTEQQLEQQTNILQQIANNTRNTPGAGNPINVAAGQRSGEGTPGGANIVASNFPTQGPPKIDSRGGYIASDYSITSNSLVT
jgi:hypothetical protein